MNCSDLQRLSLAGELEAKRQLHDVQAHLRECQACRTLYETAAPLNALVSELTDAGTATGMPLELAAALKHEDASLLGRLRALGTPRRRLIVAGFGAVLGLSTYLVWLRVDYAEYSALRMALVLLAFASGAAAAAWLSVRSLAEPERRQLRLWVAAFALLAPLVAAFWPQAPFLHPANPGRDAVVLGAIPCLLIGLGVAAPVIALWRSVDRIGGFDRTDLVVIAAAGGAVGNLVLQLHCAVTRVAHLALGHASVGVLLAAVAVIASRRRA